jgi:hypothetical protein
LGQPGTETVLQAGGVTVNDKERFLRFKSEDGTVVFFPLFPCGFETVTFQIRHGYVKSQVGGTWYPAEGSEVGQQVLKAVIYGSGSTENYAAFYGAPAEEFLAWLELRAVGYFGGRG